MPPRAPLQTQHPARWLRTFHWCLRPWWVSPTTGWNQDDLTENHVFFFTAKRKRVFSLVFLVEMALSGKKSNKLGEWGEEKSKNVWNEDCDYCWLMFDRTFDNDHWWWMKEELWLMVIHGDWWLVIDGDWWMNGWMDDGNCMMQPHDAWWRWTNGSGCFCAAFENVSSPGIIRKTWQTIDLLVIVNAL